MLSTSSNGSALATNLSSQALELRLLLLLLLIVATRIVAIMSHTNTSNNGKNGNNRSVRHYGPYFSVKRLFSMSFHYKTYNRHGLHNIDFQAYVTLLLLMPDMGSPLSISMGCACNYLSLWSSREDYPINQCHFNLVAVLYVL